MARGVVCEFRALDWASEDASPPVNVASFPKCISHGRLQQRLSAGR